MAETRTQLVTSTLLSANGPQNPHQHSKPNQASTVNKVAKVQVQDEPQEPEKLPRRSSRAQSKPKLGSGSMEAVTVPAGVMETGKAGGLKGKGAAGTKNIAAKRS